MFTTKRIAASIGAAFALGIAPLASAAIDPVSAIADGTLKFTNFRFTTGGNALCTLDPVTNAGLCRNDTVGSVFILNGNETADASVSLNGTSLPQVTVSSNLGDTFVAASGLGPSYVAPTVPVPLTTGDLGSQNGSPILTTGAVTSLVSGGTSWSNGNSLTGSADVVIQSQVVLNGAGQAGSAQVNQNLSTEFFLVSQADREIDLDFTATRFWRGALGQNGILAKGSTSFTIAIDIVADTNGINNADGATLGENVMTFSPSAVGNIGGTCVTGSILVSAGSCSTTAPFILNGSREAPNSGGDTLDAAFLFPALNAVQTGNFNISIDLPTLPATLSGSTNPADYANPQLYYKFTITGGAVADAETPVPAPGILALMGIGLLGLGAVRRRRAS